jgi:tRNA(fMet)-specific endonuclease VapC
MARYAAICTSRASSVVSLGWTLTPLSVLAQQDRIRRSEGARGQAEASKIGFAVAWTTFLIDAERTGDDLDKVIDDDDDIAIAAVTIAELRVGGLLADRRRKASRSAYVEDIISTIPVIDYDIDVAEAHAELLVEVRAQDSPRGAHDLIIAATARASKRTVVTSDFTAFADLPGVTVLDHR